MKIKWWYIPLGISALLGIKKLTKKTCDECEKTFRTLNPLTKLCPDCRKKAEKKFEEIAKEALEKANEALRKANETAEALKKFEKKE